jgi:hypothetical protein
MEQAKHPYEQIKIRVGYQHIRKIKVDIQIIADHMTGKIIEAVDIVYGEDTLTIWLDDGSSVELIIDSIFANIPDLDD